MSTIRKNTLKNKEECNRKRIYRIRRLVLEGGGVKGVAIVGAMKVLEEKGLLKHINQIAGSSAGGIVAVLYAIGYTVSELENVFNEINFSKLKDDSFGIIRDLNRFCNEYGFYKGDYFKKIMNKFLFKKTGKNEYTFKQLYDDRGIELLLTGTNINYKRTDYFHYKTTPNMNIIDAVRITMSIPLFFRSVVNDNCHYVDGGMLNNYPFTAYWKLKNIDATSSNAATSSNNVATSSSVYVSSKEVSKKYLRETIGIKVENEEEMIEHSGGDVYNPIDNLMDFSKLLIETLLETIEKQNSPPYIIKRTILIPTSISGMNFDLTNKEKEELFTSGVNAAKVFMYTN
jgi:NTE family protein